MEQAKGKVFIENGKVVGAEEPKVKRCPLHKIMYGKDIYHTKEFIMEHVRMKIKKVGMFTENCILESEEDTVPFGASEMLMCAKQQGIIDYAVLACDCAGTVIATTPRLIQGIGEWIAGLVETSPISEVIERIQKAGGIVIDSANANINQVEGVKRAFVLTDEGKKIVEIRVKSINRPVSIYTEDLPYKIEERCPKTINLK